MVLIAVIAIVLSVILSFIVGYWAGMYFLTGCIDEKKRIEEENDTHKEEL